MKKNGFTLVELLAVIVILGIIMIIAIPSVLQVLSASRIKTFSVYAKKVRTEAEKTNYKNELDGSINTTGMYIYDIKKDLGLSSTGNYKGYVVVDGCSGDEKEYYVYLADDTFMLLDYGDSDPENIVEYEKFGNYNDTSWNESAGTKEQVAANVINMNGEYTCKAYSEDGSELTAGGGGGGPGIPDTPSGANSAVFAPGYEVDYIMLNELRGDKNFYIKDQTNITTGLLEKAVYSKIYDGSDWRYVEDGADKTIKSVIKSNTMSDEQLAKSKIVSSSDSPKEIRMWYENNNIYWYTEATKVFANKNASYMFAYLGALQSIDVSKIDFSQTTDISYLFYTDIAITSIDVSSMNTVNVTNMTETFYNMQNLEALNISMWNTSKVKDVGFMLAYLTKATMIRFPKNLVNKNTISMQGLFYEDNNVASLDVSGFDTSNVTSFYGLFEECLKLKQLDVSKWNTSNVTNMSQVFLKTTSLKSLNLSTWDVSKVEDFRYSFYQDTGLTTLDLSKWHVKNGIETEAMFYQMSNLTTIYVNESWRSKITTGKAMFTGCFKLVGGNGTKYTNSSSNTQNATRAIIDGENGEKGYFTEKGSGETVQ